jgi:hypothetical protein
MENKSKTGNGAETAFQSAVDLWWKKKQSNKEKISASQGGDRDANLRGDTMDGFRDVIIEALLEVGVLREDIFFQPQLSKQASNLPAYFRATKNWDVIVCKNSLFKGLIKEDSPAPTLLAAIEFKSQEQSIGNNQNNRIEESIGNAHDFWAAYENRNFGRLTPRPWLGYLFVGRYAAGEENKTVQITQPHLRVDRAFAGPDEDAWRNSIKIQGPSYAERYKIFLERMIAKKLYDGACFLVTHEDIAHNKPNYRVLFDSLSGVAFIDGLRRHIRAYYAD